MPVEKHGVYRKIFGAHYQSMRVFNPSLVQKISCMLYCLTPHGQNDTIPMHRAHEYASVVVLNLPDALSEGMA
jgi:hypothetical protein